MGTGEDNPDSIGLKYKLLIGCAHFVARVLDKIYEGEDVWEDEDAWFWVLDWVSLRTVINTLLDLVLPQVDMRNGIGVVYAQQYGTNQSTAVLTATN